MITREMLRTLQSIKKQEEMKGAATAPQINVYKHRTTLYGALEKLDHLDTIEVQEAPTTSTVKKTYTTTEFGSLLVEKAEKAGLLQKRQDPW